MTSELARTPRSLEDIINSRSDNYISSFVERFWNKVDKSDECWEWCASTTSSGYGQIIFTGVDSEQHVLLSHRVSAYLYWDRGVDERQVNHNCHNKRCVNPNHMYLGTQQDNVDDSVESGIVGLGLDNVSGKLTDSEVREIRRKYSTTEKTQRDLADEYGVTQTHIWRIVNNESR